MMRCSRGLRSLEYGVTFPPKNCLEVVGLIHTTESFLRIETIFHEALDAPADTRSRLITERCGADTALITEVLALLEASLAEESETESRRAAKDEQPGDESAPHRGRIRIGPYEVDRLLGRGGMGAVYLANRVDGQFEQQVAIKLIDLPLATDVFRERFRQERQILAGLQHPFIARLLDGGVTGDGDPYLAMEYVKGVPITRFCETRELAIPQRLRLFKSVCEAVQFAHQNLVVHRDLKPDNILVAEDGTPRLLDFGTAKLVSPTLAGPESEMTRQGYQTFTPQYASPEQVFGNPITTASDTYSLGVLLYLLLTGKLPYELKEMTTAEMVRVICTEPARKPGLAINSEEKLDIDLEAILTKALRKEPADRYKTAEQMSSDIQDFLDGRPVAARRGTFQYRAAKFVRRNRLALTGAAVLAFTLLAGVAGVLWQYRVATEERRKAQARSADLRELSNSLLSELDEAIKQLPGSTGVQKILVMRVLEHLDRMSKDAEGDRATQLDLMDAYTRLGNLQGNPYYQNLGDPAGGLLSIDKAIGISGTAIEANRGLGGNDRGQTREEVRALTRALATALGSRSEILFGIGRTQEAVAAMQAAVQSWDRLIASPTASPELLTEVAANYGTLGDLLGQPGTASLGDRSGALDAYKKTIALDKRALAIDPKFPRALRGVALLEMKIASVEMETDPAQALKDFGLALQRVDAIPKSDQSDLTTLRLRAMILRKEANAMSEQGHYSEAFPLFDQVLELHKDLSEKDPQDLRALQDLNVILDDEAVAYENAADPTLAEPSASSTATLREYALKAANRYEQEVGIFERMLKQDPSNETWKSGLAGAQVQVGDIRQFLGSNAEAEALSRKGVNSLRELAKSPDASPLTLDRTVTALLDVKPVSLRNPALAVELAERGVALSHRKRLPMLLLLAQAYHAHGEFAKAQAVAREGLAMIASGKEGSTRLQKLFEVELRARA